MFRNFLTFSAIAVASLTVGGMLTDDKNAAEAARNYGVTQSSTQIVIDTKRPQNQYADASTVTPLADDIIREDEIELIIKGNEGVVLRALAPKDNASIFFRGQLSLIEQYRERANRTVDDGLERVFATSFADSEFAVENFADWFFSWGRNYDFLGKSLVGALGEVLSFSPSEMMEGAREDVEAHFTKHYLEQVLKPEIRNPTIESGVRGVLSDAHREYMFLLEESDERLKEFVLANARYIEQVDPSRAVMIKLDWNSEKFKAPIYRADEAVQAGMRGIAFVLGGAAAGPAFEAGFGTLMAVVAGETLATTEAVVIGGAVGSEVPILGTVIGAVAGLAADFVVNRISEGMNRSEFVAETNQAVELTTSHWQKQLTSPLRKEVQQWFDDTRNLMMTPDLEKKLDLAS